MNADQAVPEPVAEADPAGPPRPDMERKVVTALVAKLVQTATPDGDTEDRISLHARMANRIQDEVRRFGGAIHTALGDTLLAVFGAERVREDDPERAVRAALAVSDLEDQAGLAVQVGVETGAAVVTPSGGEGPHPFGAASKSLVPGVTGAALDVAASLGLSAAPRSVLVGPAAYRATVRQVDYEPARSGAWRPLAPRSRIGSTVVADATGNPPLLERDRELAVLQTTLGRVRRDREPQMVTLIGAPGIGKSRLVAEFGRLVDAEEELILWRQARTVPYGGGGEGVTLWALAEIVRAQAGILESDPDEVVASKLRQAITAVIPDASEQDRVEQRLRPLVQVASLSPEAEQQRQVVQAWVRLIEMVADDRPLVVVVEDLHWADSELLDCLEDLVERVAWVPLLIVGTTRPELLEHRPAWGGGKRNAVTMGLTPLTEQGSGALLDALLADVGGTATLPEATRARLLTHAAGIPLYLEEYVRMLRDQVPLEGDPPLEGGLPLPETVQQIISARLDTLPAGEKALLQDMAVLGEVGRREPLAVLTGLPPEAVGDALTQLARHDLIRPVRPGRRDGPLEYVFRHALVRDVAYGLLLRAERAGKHRQVAEWLTASRSDERAEEIAHHYQRALAFTQETGTPMEPLAKAARLAFHDAGDRAVALGALATAIRYYDRALELWPHDDPDRADLLLHLGDIRAVANATGETELLAARDLFEAAGDSSRAAQASARLGGLARLRGDKAASQAHNQHAMRLAGTGTPSRAAAEILMHLASEEMMADHHEQAIQTGRKAIRMASVVGAADVEAASHGVVGSSRLKSGDIGGDRELAQAATTLDERHDQFALVCHFARVRGLWRYGDLAAAAEALEVGRQAATAYGSEEYQGWMNVMEAVLAHAAGRWDGALEILERWLDRFGGELWYTSWCLTLRACIRLDRGDLDGASDDASAAVSGLPPDPFPEALQPALAMQARALLAAGHTDRAAEQLERLLAGIRAHPGQSMATPDLAAVLVDLDYPADALPAELTDVRWHHAARAFVQRDFPRAAGLYGDIGALPEQTLARFRHARSLADHGEPKEAVAVLADAIAFWEQVGAHARMRDAQALLDRCS